MHDIVINVSDKSVVVLTVSGIISMENNQCNL